MTAVRRMCAVLPAILALNSCYFSRFAISRRCPSRNAPVISTERSANSMSCKRSASPISLFAVTFIPRRWMILSAPPPIWPRWRNVRHGAGFASAMRLWPGGGTYRTGGRRGRSLVKPIISRPGKHGRTSAEKYRNALAGFGGAAGSLGRIFLLRCLRSAALFRCEQGAFAFHAPSIPCKTSVRPHHTMAGDEECDGVARTRPRHGANGIRLAECSCDIGVADSLPGRDFSERLPNARLKRSALNIERQIKRSCPRCGQIADELLHPGIQIVPVFDEGGRSEASSQIGNKGFRVVSESDSADPARADRKDDPTDPSLGGRVADGLSGTAAAPGARRHPQAARCCRIRARARCETGGIDRLGHGHAALQFRSEAPQPMGAKIGPRRRAHDLGEHTVEMMSAHPHGSGKLREIKRGLCIAHKRAGALDGAAVAFHRRGFGRAAAFARPEPCFFGLGGGRKKGDILESRQPRAAGGPAIDACGLHRIDECAVVTRIAGTKGGPTGCGVEFLEALAGILCGWFRHTAKYRPQWWDTLPDCCFFIRAERHPCAGDRLAGYRRYRSETMRGKPNCHPVPEPLRG